MKFDKSRVFTALNADELKAGDIVFVADSIAGLKDMVENDIAAGSRKIERVGTAEEAYRFHVKCSGQTLCYNCAYLVERTGQKRRNDGHTKTAMK